MPGGAVPDLLGFTVPVDAQGYVIATDGALAPQPLSTSGVRCLAVADATVQQLTSDNATALWVDGANALPTPGAIFGTLGAGLMPVVLLAVGGLLLYGMVTRR